MQLVASSPLAGLCVFLILFLGPRRGLWVLFATLPLGATAAFQVAGFGSVTVTDLSVAALWFGLILRLQVVGILREMMPGRPGFLLLILGMIGVVSALYFPRVFAKTTQVIAITERDGRAVLDAVALTPSGANMGQLARLALGMAAFYAVAAVLSADARWQRALACLWAASLVHVLITILDWGSHAFGFDAVLDPIRTVSQAILSDQSFPGLRRLIGGFTEPASFGLFTMGLVGFWLRMSISDSGFRWAGLMTLVFVIFALRSTSSATIANLALLMVVFPLWYARRILWTGRRLRVLLMIIGVLPALYGITSISLGFSPMGTDLVDALVWSKALSESGVERAHWNLQALQGFYDTYGIGAGIGSARASGWPFAVLVSFGLPGAVIYLAFLWRLLRPEPALIRQTQTPEICSALRWACFAVLFQSCFTRPFPDLGVAFFAMAGLIAGLRAYQTQPRSVGAGRSSVWRAAT